MRKVGGLGGICTFCTGKGDMRKKYSGPWGGRPPPHSPYSPPSLNSIRHCCIVQVSLIGMCSCEQWNRRVKCAVAFLLTNVVCHKDTHCVSGGGGAFCFGSACIYACVNVLVQNTTRLYGVRINIESHCTHEIRRLNTEIHEEIKVEISNRLSIHDRYRNPS